MMPDLWGADPYIEVIDLERDKARLKERIKQLESTIGQVSKALCGKENATLDEVLQAVRQVKTELEAVKRERDAAVSGLVGTCQECRWEETEKCASCHFNIDAWNVYDSNWEWRGVCSENCPENTEVQE